MFLLERKFYDQIDRATMGSHIAPVWVSTLLWITLKRNDYCIFKCFNICIPELIYKKLSEFNYRIMTENHNGFIRENLNPLSPGCQNEVIQYITLITNRMLFYETVI